VEISRRLNQILGPLIALLLMVYFAYHILQGERGLFSWMRMRQKIAETEHHLEVLQAERETLERQVYLLRPESLDRDMLEQQARKILNYAAPDEVVVYDDELSPPASKEKKSSGKK
jgi:cell division protein FtsB